jgi:hypothetical protein
MGRAFSELGLGIQVALASRTTRLRTVLTAGGVALGVIVLALAASAPHAYSARKARERAATPVFDGTHGRLRLLDESTMFDGVTIGENAVQVTGSRAAGTVPRPPGVTHLPGPGEMVVSPEVRRLLRGPGGDELRRRLDARIVGTVGSAGLSDPREAVLYRGSSRLAARKAPTVTRFGAVGDSGPTPVLITLLVIMIVVALLLPAVCSSPPRPASAPRSATAAWPRCGSSAPTGSRPRGSPQGSRWWARWWGWCSVRPDSCSCVRRSRTSAWPASTSSPPICDRRSPSPCSSRCSSR